MSKLVTGAWLVLRQSARKGVIIAGVRQERPALAEDEVAVKLRLSIPSRIFIAAPTIAADVTEDDIVQPDITATIDHEEV